MFSFESDRKTRSAIPWYVMGLIPPLVVIVARGRPVDGDFVGTYFPVLFFVTPSIFLIGIGLTTQFWQGTKDQLLRVQKAALIIGLIISGLAWFYVAILI